MCKFYQHPDITQLEKGALHLNHTRIGVIDISGGDTALRRPPAHKIAVVPE